MPDEWDTMRETDALLRLTQILSMSLQTNTLLLLSHLYLFFAQLKLPSASCNLERNIVCLTSNKPAW